jgi:SAM-dependent methyltransferase/Flp pilus assembly protein TadD
MKRKARRAAGKRAPGLPQRPGTDVQAAACLQDGNRLAQQGRFAEAASHYQRAIAARPAFAHALANLGNAMIMLGEPAEAIDAWRRAVAADPAYALPHSNLGIALSQQGRLDEAIAHLRRAVEIKPDFLEALDNLARTLLAAGHASQAMQAACRAIAIGPTGETKKVFVDCLRHAAFPADEPDLQRIVLQAVTERWARPDRLIGPAAALAKRSPALAPCVEAVAKAWPARLASGALWSPAQRSAACRDPLLRALLETAPVCDLDLEHFLTTARSVLLAQAQAATIDDSEVAFGCALARQCFINEYVFALSDGEIEQAERLKHSLVTALASGGTVPPLWLAAVGAYAPLHSLPQSAALIARAWPPAVRTLLLQQVQEPLEELADRTAIPALTAIENTVSLAVREQYEENPYPRWIEMPPSRRFDRFDSYLRGALPWADIRPDSESCDILVAGCGTGQQSIEVALRSKDARVLAIDLSLASLAYARRKTRALGLANVDYAQADILQAPSIGRVFDVIEAGGVLHHLDDPMAGWRALLALLRPGGFMYLGLYSEAGRQAVVAVREFIAARGYQRSAGDIRRFRQDVVTAGLPLGNLLTSPDFFSSSGCRDLFFHAQEHRLSLPQIKSFLQANHLTFLGFQVDAQVLRQFRHRYKAAEALTDLDLWHAFETANPRAFAAMYQFWIQKPR